MGTKWTDIKGRYIRDPRYGHRLGKSYLGTEKKKKPGYYEHITELSTDQYGFIHNGHERELPPEFNNNNIGIIILGGSLAMGLGATANSKTIASVLEKKLRNEAPHKKINVINAALGGYGSWEEMSYFLLELINRKPQLVVSITGVNDFSNGFFGSKYYDTRLPNTSRSLEDVAEAVKLTNRSISFIELAKYKFKKTKIFKKLINISRRFTGQVELTEQNFLWGAENIKEEYDLNMAKIFWTNQISILGACKSHNISHHLYIQPNYFWGQKQTLSVEEKKGIEADRKLLKKKYEENIKKYYQDILEEKKKYEHHFNGDKYILKSFFEIFNQDKNQCYVDFAHLSDYGQSILADKIKENIISSKILDY